MSSADLPAKPFTFTLASCLYWMAVLSIVLAEYWAMGIEVILPAWWTVLAALALFLAWRRQLDWARFGSLVALGLVAGCLMPLSSHTRGEGRRSQCRLNLKWLGLAVHNYHDKRQAFAPPQSTSQESEPLLSWRVHLLPYLEQTALHKRFNLNQDWKSATNLPLADEAVWEYRCPTDDGPTNETSYLAVEGQDTCFPPSGPIGLNDLPDGSSRTILFVEAHSSGVPWTVCGKNSWRER